MSENRATGQVRPRDPIRGTAIAVGVAVAMAAVAMTGLVQAQQAPPAAVDQPAQSPAPAPLPPAAQASPPSDKKDGFLTAFERWWDKSAADFKASVDENNAKWRQLGERSEKAAKDAATASKEAADAFSNLSKIRVVEGRQVCATAANGSPDCNAAAEVICKDKGFTSGKSADIQTNRKCSARAWLSGSPSGDDCKVETIVLKAACQ